jgi:hypothetical protein
MNNFTRLTSYIRGIVVAFLVVAFLGASFTYEVPLDRLSTRQHQLDEESSCSWGTSLPPNKPLERSEKQTPLPTILPETHDLHPVLFHEREQVATGIQKISSSLFVTQIASSYF